MEDVAEVFGVLSHATRLRIITLLHQGEFDVSEIGARLEVSVTNISQHLALLRGLSLADHPLHRQRIRVFICAEESNQKHRGENRRHSL